MTHNLKSLINIKNHVEKINFADGGTVESTYKGTYVGFINEFKIILKDVLHIPTFKRSLISVHQLTKQHFKVYFYDYNNISKVSLYDKNKNKV